MKNSNLYKQQTINQWTKYPIGAEPTKYKEGTKESFDDITRNLFYRFSNIKLYTRHIDIRLSDRPINRILKTKGIHKIFVWTSLRWGWYLIIEAEK